MQEHGRRALVLERDASDESAVAARSAAVDEEFGQVDILINLAYTPLFSAPEELTLDVWRGLRDQRHELLPLLPRSRRRMIAQGRGGAIMNMCSICGTSATGRGSFPYSIAKGGIAMMTKELAIEWAEHGIRANAIQPFQFLTPGLRHRLDNPDLATFVRSSSPASR